jgi:hypothetical protein
MLRNAHQVLARKRYVYDEQFKISNYKIKRLIID